MATPTKRSRSISVAGFVSCRAFSAIFWPLVFGALLMFMVRISFWGSRKAGGEPLRSVEFLSCVKPYGCLPEASRNMWENRLIFMVKNRGFRRAELLPFKRAWKRVQIRGNWLPRALTHRRRDVADMGYFRKVATLWVREGFCKHGENQRIRPAFSDFPGVLNFHKSSPTVPARVGKGAAQ